MTVSTVENPLELIFRHRAWSLAAGGLPYISQNGVSTREPIAFDADELREWIRYTGDLTAHLFSR
jgi:hypothetical protein